MQKTLFILFAAVLLTNCTSPEPESNYSPADYIFPSEAKLRTNNITTDSFQFLYDNDGTGNVYYVVSTAESEEPTNEQIINGTAPGQIESGSFEINGNRVIRDIIDLCNNSSYTVYTVQKTPDNFISDLATSINATTSIKNIAGEYEGTPAILGTEGPEFTTTITPIAGTDNEYTISTAWGENFYAWVTTDDNDQGMNVYSGKITINNDNTIVIEGDDAWATGGTGTFTNDCLNTFTYKLNQTLTAKPFETDVTITQIQ